MNAKKLNRKMIERGFTIDAVSELIGVDMFTMYRKVYNYEVTTIGEAMRLKHILDLSDQEAIDIFLRTRMNEVV